MKLYLVTLSIVLITVESFSIQALAADPGEAIETVLQESEKERIASEVMILGTAHLVEFEDRLQAEHLTSTLDRLQAFAPASIAIERIPPDEIALLAEYAQKESGADLVISQFVSRSLEYGQQMQQQLSLDRIGASQRASALLDNGINDAEQRVRLIGYFVAAYKFDSAALQWSYLSEQERENVDSLPEVIIEAFERTLQSSNEITTVAIELAKRLDIQYLIPIDSHFEVIRLLSYPLDDFVTLAESEAMQRMRASEPRQRIQEEAERAFEAGDLLHLYRYYNSELGQHDFAVEWTGWLQSEDDAGLGAFRYMLWELRNQRMATNVLNIAASPHQEPLLVLVGAAHKSFMDRALQPFLSVRLTHFADYDE